MTKWRLPRALLLCAIILVGCAHAQAGTITLAWDPNSEPDLAGYRIYYGTASRQYTVVLDVGNVTSYTIPDLDETVLYYFAVTAYDTAGNESEYSDEVSGYPADRTAPTVLSATAVAANRVEVHFSEPVDRSSAENPANYRIEPGIQVLSAALDSNQQVVHLTTSPHVDGQSYILTISGVQDQANPPNVIAQGTAVQYVYHAVDTQAPTVLAVQVQDAEHLLIAFSEPVEKSSAESISNYQIEPTVTILSAALDSSGLRVRLTTEPHTPGLTYTLSIVGIKDRANPPNSIGQAVQFSYVYMLPLRFRFLSAGEYAADYLQEGDAYYLDRDYRIQSIPDSLEHCLWVRTAMSDKDNSDDVFLRFEVNQKVSVYVGYDKRVNTYPQWLSENFVRTRYAIDVSGPADSLYLWRKDFAAGEILLGGNRATGAEGTRDMYIVLVRPNPNAQVEPTEKENPTSPQQPQQPEQPQEPQQPQNPQEPQNPDQPQEPQNPDEPQQPDNPQEPNQPDSPQEPEQPQEPEEPHRPAENVGLTILSTGEFLTGHPTVGDRYYLDRDYRIESMPDSLADCLWILTAMSDKDNADSLFLVFQVDTSASVYVAYDSRATSYPAWLTSMFARTNLAIDVEGPADSLVLWRADVPQGTVVLGGNRARGAVEPRDMYVVLVKSASTHPQDSEDHETPPPPQAPNPRVPDEFRVYQNYPNPFNPDTEIRFDLPEPRRVTVAIYNMLGQRVRLLLDRELLPGQHKLTWDARDDLGRPVPGGAYFVRVEAVRVLDNQGLEVPVGSWAEVRKMIYLR